MHHCLCGEVGWENCPPAGFGSKWFKPLVNSILSACVYARGGTGNGNELLWAVLQLFEHAAPVHAELVALLN